MAEPTQPDRETREQFLGVLAELIAQGGAERFLLPPVAPGGDAFPEPWAPTTAGVQLLLRRLLWHAGIERAVELDDDRLAKAPPTERKPATRVEITELAKTTPAGSKAAGSARFTVYFIGEDEIAGTLAHEVGTLYAALHRVEKADPYRTAEPPTITIDPDRDLERGSIATVYLGLGVLAANAAFQQYSSAGRFNGGYVPLEYDVLRAGAVPMSALAYLLAVQATVRGDDAPPRGLAPPQRDEVADWMKALDGQGATLRERLGIAASTAVQARPAVEPLDDELPPFEEPAPKPTAFRWQTHRGGVGFVAGTVMGVGLAFALARGMLPLTLVGGGTLGHLIGRRVRAPRCSACATVLPEGATTCAKCGAVLRGDIANLGDRLEAEERLEEENREQL
ncbi:MAG TPA: zinc ribbon domain-containing protein [Kofleriaceae bacterium]|nr:zinc ribbon domain-containing protein [Kofleriaceae bacterium]